MFLDFSYMLCLLSMKFEWLSSEYDDRGQQVVSHKPVEQVKHGKHLIIDFPKFNPLTATGIVFYQKITQNGKIYLAYAEYKRNRL